MAGIFPDFLGSSVTSSETIYIEVPSDLQGGRPWKHIIVTAKVKMQRKKKKLKVHAILIDKYF